MYKKVKLSILSFIIALCTFAPSTFAAEGSELENKEVIIFEAQEIKDNNALLSRAKEGVTDNLELDKNMNTLMEVKDKNGKKVNLSKKDVQITSQKLKAVKKGTKVVESYVTTVFSEATFEKSNGNISILGYDTGKGGLDSTLSVYSYSRVYYEIVKGGSGNINHYDITKATGYWTLQDVSTGIKNTNVTLQQWGTSTIGGVHTVNNSKKFDVGTSFSVVADAKWEPVSRATGTVVNAVMRCTITEGSSSWNVIFINSVI
ncbi:hypothetical protein RCG19_11940 [Neobacillus sp. OS1-2]|uniref:hypothetical protein n=1 Tax=Neobacillus sp. OS1-2 TaxID=3070680 RepID=UPI0027E05725|nr:hypothetical protein [Neobacillus sp. OS1-2]WML37960.1 hypothetical protein RCG19_11940 [Neobacillus sp. OS1-2]